MNFRGIHKFELGGKSMENDYSSFLQKDENGSITSFDESKMASYIDSLLSKAVASYKAKVAKEQEMSKLDGEQRLAKQMEEFEASKKEWEISMKNQRRDLVIEKAKAKLANDFSETEIELFTKNITDDEKESLKYIDALVAERKKFLDESQKKIIEKLQSNQPSSSTESNADGKIKKPAPTISAEEIKKRYK